MPAKREAARPRGFVPRARSFGRALSRLVRRVLSRPLGGSTYVGDLRRLLAAAGAFVVAVALTTVVDAGGAWEDRLAAGWDAAALVYLALAWAFIGGATSARTRAWARDQDSRGARFLRSVVGRTVGLGFILSVGGAGFVLATGLVAGADADRLSAALGAVGVVAAWLVLQTAYGLYYAYLYYRRGYQEGGIEFPGDLEPDGLDFAYFAFTVGTAFAVSDARVTDRAIRRVVLGQAVLSFAYNTAILALAFGILLGLA